jgi:hypothetical protein
MITILTIFGKVNVRQFIALHIMCRTRQFFVKFLQCMRRTQLTLVGVAILVARSLVNIQITACQNVDITNLPYPELI